MYIIAAIQYSIWSKLIWYNIYQNANYLCTIYKHKSCDNLLASELNVSNYFSSTLIEGLRSKRALKRILTNLSLYAKNNL